ncbi:male sterility protein-domain-containing protein [Aspergillus crustosus]
MVPSRVTIVSNLPLNPYGKIDREALSQISQGLENGKGHATSSQSNGDALDPENEVYSTLKLMVRGLINVPDLQDNDNFFALGMSSLESARFIGLLMQQYRKKVTMDMLLDNPTVVKVAAMLKETKEVRPALVDTVVMQADTLLADDIPVVPNWQAQDEGRVFITGVTGFVGVHLLSQLLALPDVKRVACLARSRKLLSAQSHIEQALKKYDIWDDVQKDIEKMIVLDGEMADETLGLGEEKFTWLTHWASAIFHVGAKVNFCEPYQSHFASNVLGTKNVLRLAAMGRRKALHYMSSIDTWGPTTLVLGTRVLREDEGLHGHRTSLPYDTSYAHSQWVAEEMVRRMRNRGLPVAIYRPGFTIGDPDDFFARLIRMEYVTVDYVCSALMHIASSYQNLGRSYSLVAPDHSQSVNIEETGVMINQAGYSVEEIPYDEWVARLRASDIDRNPLSPLMPLLEEPVLRELSRLQTSKYTPLYDTPNTVEDLADRPGIQYTPLDSALLKRYLDNWARKGFYEIVQGR